MNNTNEVSAAIAQAARQLVDEYPYMTRILLVKTLAERTGCHISTARRHIIAALSNAVPRQRGGKQPGAGRPTKINL